MRVIEVAVPKPGRTTRLFLGLIFALVLTAPLALPSPWTVAEAATSSSIWSASVVPEQRVDPDPRAVTVGTRFSTRVAGEVTHLRFYRAAQNVGPHDVMLWSRSGSLLTQARVPEPTPTGWVSVALRAPVRLTPNVEYVAAYRAPQGRYSTTIGTFDRGRRVSSGALTASAGVYTYSEGVTPDRTWRGAAYFADVVFQPESGDGGGTTQPSTTTPTSGTTTTRPSTTAPPATTSTSTTSAPSPTVTPTTTPTTTPTQTAAPILSLPRIPWEGGSAYYAQFQDAARNGWTDPGFLPIAVWWGGVSTDAEARWDKDHGINTYVLLDRNSPTTTAVLERHGMSYIGGALAGMNRNSRSWVGDFLDDEVDGRFEPPEGEAHLGNIVSRLPDHNKIRYANYSSLIVNTWVKSADASTYVNDFTDTVSLDMYWYTVPFCDWQPFPGAYYYLKPVTQSTCRTSHSYGLSVDMLRDRDAMDGRLQPVWNFIENVSGAPAENGNPPLMTPGRVKGAAMNSIIHEARGLIYFNQVFHGACGTGNAVRTAQAVDNWACDDLIEAMGSVNNTILGLAPVINTQSYIWSFGPDLDTMLKVKDGYAYIFAMTNGGAGSRSFTLPSGVNGREVEVLNESRTLPVSAQIFTDSFATESTFHIYRVKL